MKKRIYRSQICWRRLKELKDCAAGVHAGEQRAHMTGEYVYYGPLLNLTYWIHTVPRQQTEHIDRQDTFTRSRVAAVVGSLPVPPPFSPSRQYTHNSADPAEWAPTPYPLVEIRGQRIKKNYSTLSVFSHNEVPVICWFITGRWYERYQQEYPQSVFSMGVNKTASHDKIWLYLSQLIPQFLLLLDFIPQEVEGTSFPPPRASALAYMYIILNM